MPTLFNRIDKEKIKFPLFISIILILFIIVLHNPTQGYLTEIIFNCEDCPSYMFTDITPASRGFFRFESLGAIWKPIGVIGTALMAIISIFIANIIWIILFCLKQKS